MPYIPFAPAVVDAVYQATASISNRFPLTAEAVLARLGKNLKAAAELLDKVAGLPAIAGVILRRGIRVRYWERSNNCSHGEGTCLEALYPDR